MTVTLEVVAEMRRYLPELKVTWEPGWETRGNGLQANYTGGLVHHTATPSSLANPFPTRTLLREGRKGANPLSGPLCNMAGPVCTVASPWIHVMAAFPANHAGASGGRSMGPLKTTRLFNPEVMGLEVDYSGLSSMTAGQWLVAQVWGRSVANVVAGGNVEFIRAHFETSVTGKIDIAAGGGRSYDMNMFRSAMRGLTKGDWFDMATEADLERIIDAKLRPIYDLLTPGVEGVKNTGAVWAKLEALPGEAAEAVAGYPVPDADKAERTDGAETTLPLGEAVGITLTNAAHAAAAIEASEVAPPANPR